jgi:hypothetical protein
VVKVLVLTLNRFVLLSKEHYLRQLSAGALVGTFTTSPQKSGYSLYDTFSFWRAGASLVPCSDASPSVCFS